MQIYVVLFFIIFIHKKKMLQKNNAKCYGNSFKAIFSNNYCKVFAATEYLLQHKSASAKNMFLFMSRLHLDEMALVKSHQSSAHAIVAET